MNLINLNLLSSTVTTNPAETLWQLQNAEISTSRIWSGFVTEQKIQNTTNNNNKKQKRNLDSGAFRPRVITIFLQHLRNFVILASRAPAAFGETKGGFICFLHMRPMRLTKTINCHVLQPGKREFLVKLFNFQFFNLFRLLVLCTIIYSTNMQIAKSLQLI